MWWKFKKARAGQFDAAIQDVKRAFSLMSENNDFDPCVLHQVLEQHEVLKSPANTHPDIEELGQFLGNYLSTVVQSGEDVPLEYLPIFVEFCRVVQAIYPYRSDPGLWRGVAFSGLSIIHASDNALAAHKHDYLCSFSKEILTEISPEKEPNLWQVIHLSLAESWGKYSEAEDELRLKQKTYHLRKVLDADGLAESSEQSIAAHMCLAEILMSEVPDTEDRVQEIVYHAKTACDLCDSAVDNEILGYCYLIYASALEVLAQGNPNEFLRPTITTARTAVDNLPNGSEEWAKSQLILGSALVTLATTPFPWKTMREAEASKQAEEALNAVLKVFNRQDHADDWSFTHFRLGWLYADTPDDRGVNRYEEAIPYYERALDILRESDVRNLYSIALYKLAFAVAQSEESDTEKLSEALQHLECARKGLEKQQNELHVASATLLRGSILSKLSNEAEDSERTPLADEALRELEKAARVLTADMMPPIHAETLILSAMAMKNATFDVEAMRAPALFAQIERAISILQKLPPTLQLAKAYSVKATGIVTYHGEDRGKIDEALADSRQALEISIQLKHQSFAARCSVLRGKLLVAKSILDKKEESSLLEAESLFESALKFYESNREKIEWIETAILRLEVSDKIAGLGKPQFLSEIVMNLEALIARDVIVLPMLLAEVHHRLGLHYYFGQKDNIDANLVEAETHIRESMSIYKSNSAEEEYLTAAGNLTRILMTTKVGNLREKRREAFKISKFLIDHIEIDKRPNQYATACSNMSALVAQQIAQGDVDDKAILYSLHYSIQSEQIWTKESHPKLWARIQINRGAMLSSGSDAVRTQFFDMSFESIHEALEILDREEHPEEWRLGHYNLGLLYSMVGDRTDQVKLLEAVRLFETVEKEMEALYPFLFPRLCKFKGLCLFDLDRPDEALREFEKSAESCFALSAQATFSDARTQLIRANQGLASAALEAGAKSGQLAQAIFIADRSRGISRRLVFERDQRHWDRLAATDRVQLDMVLGEILRLEEDVRRTFSERQVGFLKIQNELVKKRTEFRHMAEELGLHPPTNTWTDDGLLPHVPKVGALVFLVHGRQQGEALIVRRKTSNRLAYERCALPEVSKEEVAKWTKNWLDTYRELRDRVSSSDEGSAFELTYEKSEKDLYLLLESLWTKVMRPLSNVVRDLMENSSLQSSGSKPFLKMVPLEYFQLLPLHAAGSMTAQGDWSGVDESFEVSYWTGTLSQAHLNSREMTTDDVEPDCSSLSLVGVLSPATDDHDAGDFEEAAKTEKALLESTFSSESEPALITGNDATIANLKVLLNEQGRPPTHLHFSCHGQFEIEAPDTSGLFLANDDLLTMSSISDLPLRDCVLVMLAACETAMADIVDLPDELISFPAAFVQAGAHNVIGAQWLIPDAETVALLSRFYSLHPKRAVPSARALNDCRRAARNGTLRFTVGETSNTRGKLVAIPAKLDYAQSPLTWAAFAHYSS